ncbi:MAG: protein-export chaperone SecB [Alphaproteobacteria bacterium]
MTDDQSPDGAGAPENAPNAAPGPQGNAEPPFVIRYQYLKDFSFENPRAPETFEGGPTPNPNAVIDVKTRPLGGRDIEVAITLETQSGPDGEPAYILELTYACVVRVGNVPKEALNPIILVEIPRMMFPFVRELVATATRNGGYSMLMLSPFDFMQLYRRRLAEEQARQASQGSDSEPTAN